MFSRPLPVMLLSAAAVILSGFNALGGDSIDVTPKPIAAIPPGTRVEKTPPRGWTNLIFVSYPRITEEDAKKLPSFAREFPTMMTAAMVANVVSEQVDDRKVFKLQRVAFGVGMAVNKRNTIISSSTQEKLGADLSFMERMTLEKNEEFMNEQVRQVASTPNMTIIDMSQYVLRDGEHRKMTVRFAILVAKASGKLGTLAWPLEHRADGSYRLAHSEMRFLPARMQEDRLVSVDGDRISFGAFPKDDAFALAKFPKGRPVSFTEELKKVAALRVFTRDSVRTLEAQLWQLWSK